MNESKQYFWFCDQKFQEPEFEFWDSARRLTKDVQNEFIKSRRPYQRQNYYAPDFSSQTMIFSPGESTLSSRTLLNFQIKTSLQKYNHVRIMLSFKQPRVERCQIKSRPICHFGQLSLALSVKLLRYPSHQWILSEINVLVSKNLNTEIQPHPNNTQCEFNLR